MTRIWAISILCLLSVACKAKEPAPTASTDDATQAAEPPTAADDNKKSPSDTGDSAAADNNDDAAKAAADPTTADCAGLDTPMLTSVFADAHPHIMEACANGHLPASDADCLRNAKTGGQLQACIPAVVKAIREGKTKDAREFIDKVYEGAKRYYEETEGQGQAQEPAKTADPAKGQENGQ